MYRKMYRQMQGVTLLELMIVVVLVALLTTIAYPQYRDFAARAKRNEAKAALLLIAQNQERFYLQNNSYTENLEQLGFDVEADFITDSESYVVRVVPGSADANGFLAEARFRFEGNELGKCEFVRIDGTGARSSEPLNDCWTRTR